MVEEARKPARRVALIAIAGAVAIVVVAAIVFVKTQGGGSPTHAAAPRDAAVAHTMAATPDAAPMIVDAAIATTPKMSKVAIETTPAGASVVYKGTTYTTPFELELPADAGKVELTISMAGYLPAKLVVAPGEAAKKITLKKKPHAATPTDPNEVPF